MGRFSRMRGMMVPLVLFGLMAPSLAARAATAIVYGERDVVVVSMPAMIDALQSALEQCSSRDRFCRVLQRCSLPGAGAVAVARSPAGTIEAIGSACSVLDVDSAGKTANGYCARNVARASACATHQTWQD